jgi:pyruvate dehydrogenase E2 component (dihydrolipoamide acetyltransferase)
MAQSFKLPDLGEGLTEGEVARWLVAVGQELAEDDPLVEIQTDKATVEIPSPYAGTVLRILVGEGEVAPVGAVLVVIGEPGEEVRESVPRRRSREVEIRERRSACVTPRSGNAAGPASRPGARSRSRISDGKRARRADYRGRRPRGSEGRDIGSDFRGAASRSAASAA